MRKNSAGLTAMKKRERVASTSRRSFLTELTIAKADFAIAKIAGGGTVPPQFDETKPLIKETVRIASWLLKQLIRQLQCAEWRGALQQIEDFLEENGDKISPEDKKRLEHQGETLWEGIQRLC